MLINEDCLRFLKTVPNDEYDLVVADPPYNNCVEDEWDNQWQTEEEYFDWLEARLEEFGRVLKPTGNLLMYCKRQFHHHVKHVLDIFLREQRSIIWVRRRMMDITRGKTLASGYEPIVWYTKSNDYFFNSDEAKVPPKQHLRHRKEYQKGGRLEKGVGLTDAWTDISALPHNSKEKLDHPTQKPLALSKRIVRIFCPEDGKVYVPFGGSGSEVEACKFFDVNWDATEINEKYCEIIRKRIKTSQKSLKKWI